MANKLEWYADLFAVKVSSKSKTADMQEELYEKILDQAELIHNAYRSVDRDLLSIYADEEFDDMFSDLFSDFDALPEEQKCFRMASTDTAMKLYSIAHKDTVTQIELLVFKVAEHVHMEWARDMIADGWKYGEENEEEKTTPYLLPFSILVNELNYSDELGFFMNIARALIVTVLNNMDFEHPSLKLKNNLCQTFESLFK